MVPGGPAPGKRCVSRVVISCSNAAAPSQHLSGARRMHVELAQTCPSVRAAWCGCHAHRGRPPVLIIKLVLEVTKTVFTLSLKASNPLPHPLASHDSLLTLKMCLLNE